MPNLYTHDGFPALKNADGTYSTELSITVTDPRLNNGRPTNIPSLWKRRALDEDAAVVEALKSGRLFPSYASIEEAVRAAETRSAAGGASVGSYAPPMPQSQTKNALMEILQSASNAAASTVSGPVDLISMSLRALGVPVPEDAVGSSAWMERRGLTKPVPQGATQVVGDTLGLLAPAAVAANAERIARGLLQVGKNAAARSTMQGMGKQRGAIVWHGSPHKFDKFDSSKIGTGQGAQAYGDGLYLAEARDVGAEYLLTGRNVGFQNWDDVGKLADKAFAQAKGDTATAQALLDELVARSTGKTTRINASLAKQVLAQGDQRASLYKVDLPDDMIGRMLDWDKPLSQQAENVRAAFHLDKFPQARIKDTKGFEAYVRTGQMLGEPTSASTKAAQHLRSKGIPGIRYLDGNSRALGAGTQNFVVFPGEENALRILERNGVPLR